MPDLILSIARGNRLLASLLLITGGIFLSRHDQIVLRWKLINGDKILRTNYPLGSTSIVFDVGGYKGDSSWDIYRKYKCNIYVFEPVKKYYQFLKKRFIKFKKIRIFNYGLSNKTEYVDIHLDDDSSSVYGNSGKLERVKVVNIKEVLDQSKIDNVDLMELNIEGGEYDLLEYLVNQRFINKFKNIQVQFHSSIKNAKLRREEIQRNLGKTHRLTYEYPFVWENWMRRSKL